MKKLFFFAAMTSVLLCSCNSSEESTDVAPASAELTFANVSTMDVLTRADEYTAPFHLYMPTTEFYTTEVDSEVTYSESVWTITTGAVYLNPAERDLYAWTPATVTPKEGAPTTFVMTSAKETAAVDLSYVKKTVNSANATDMELTLDHAYARVTITLVPENYGGGLKLNTLSLDEVALTGELEAGSATVTPGAAGSLKLVENGSAVFDGEQSALVVPMTSVTLKVNCTLDDNAFGPLTVSGITKLDAGYQYNITLSVKGTLVSIKSVSVNPWGTGENGSAELK